MYYHGSRKLFTPGAQLLPQRDGYASQRENREFENLVESRRPAGKTSRRKCVFLVKDIDLIDAAGGYNDAVYTVKPGSPPEESDLAWYSDAFCALDSQDAELATACIDKYWSGEPYPEPDRRCPEWRCRKADVIQLHELNVELDELERVDEPSPSP